MNSELERKAFAAGMRKAAEMAENVARIFNMEASTVGEGAAATVVMRKILSAIPGSDARAALSTEAQECTPEEAAELAVDIGCLDYDDGYVGMTDKQLAAIITADRQKR